MFVLLNDEVKKNCIGHIQNLPERTVWDVQIREHKSKRSLQQNALYWKWLGIIGDVLGWDAEDLHESMKQNFIGFDDKVDPVTGKVFQVPRSSKKLGVKKFSEFMDKVYAFAQSENITLPEPAYYGFDTKD